MLYIETNNRMIQYAQTKSDEMGRLNNSFLQGNGNKAGFIGECIAWEVFGGTICNTYDYDIILPNMVTADVKTKTVNREPKLYHEASVQEYSLHQKCDIFIFVHLLKNFKGGWVSGWIFKDCYLETYVLSSIY